MDILINLALIIVPLIILIALGAGSLFTVQQGKVAVVTRFNKLKGFYNPGLNFKVPLIDRVSKTITTMQESVDLAFQAITQDKANVKFSALVIYKAKNMSEEIIMKIAYTFDNTDAFKSSLCRTIEGHVRAFIANMHHDGVLGVRETLAKKLQEDLLETMDKWGYELVDVQINDITFYLDGSIDGMEKTVRSMHSLNMLDKQEKINS